MERKLKETLIKITEQETMSAYPLVVTKQGAVHSRS